MMVLFLYQPHNSAAKVAVVDRINCTYLILFFTKVKVLVTMYLCYLPVWPLGLAVRALDSQFRGPRFKSCADH